MTKLAQCCRTDVHTLRRKLRGDLDWITFKAMEKNRIHRYQTAHAMAEDIQRYLNHEPVLAGQPSKVYRLKKFIRKHRPQIIWSVTVAILLAALVVISVMAFKAANRNKEAEFREHEFTLSRALQYYSNGQYENALTEVESILHSKRVGPAARLLFGRLLILVGRYSKAEAELRKLLGEEPQIAGTAHYLLAMIYMGSDSVKAEVHQQRAEELLPQTAEAYCLRAMAASTPAEAIGWLSKAVALDPSHYPSLKALALAYFASKDYDKMAYEVGVIIGRRPMDPLGYALRAAVLRETGEPNDAIVNLEYAINICKVENALAELHNQRRETYVRIGNYKAALKDARRCVELEPEQFVYHFHVFTALVSLGDYEAARREHRKIVHDDIVQQQQFEAWAQRYVFSILGAGQSFELPADIEKGDAFSAMQEATEYYRTLKAKAKRLVSGVYGQSSWSPDGTQLAYGRSDLYAWQPQPMAPAISGSGGIEILNLESGKTRLLVSFGKDPAWSPDGQHIAFVREPKRIRDYEEEVWIITAEGKQPRRLALGAWPIWAPDSKELYFHSRMDNMLYSIRIDEPIAKREPVISCPSRFPWVYWVSPEEKYVAYGLRNELRIVELPFGSVKTSWTAPLPASGMLVRWSPNGKELSVAGLTGSDLGLWIFDVEREKVRQIFDAPAISGIWSPDMSKMVIEIKIPFEENWLVTLDPNMRTYQALAPALTPLEFLHHRVEQCTLSIELDPLNADNYLSRALVYARLQEYEKAMADLGEGAKHLKVKGIKTGITGNMRDLTALMDDFTQRIVEQYHNGAYPEALVALTSIDAIHHVLYLESHPHYTALIAMALQHLDRDREAEAALSSLERLFEHGKHMKELSHLCEAERFFAGKDSKVCSVWEYIEDRKLEEASQLLEELRQLPQYKGSEISRSIESAVAVLAWMYYNRGKSSTSRRGYGETISDYKAAVRTDPNYARALSDLAWLQAACPAEEPRDSTKAVENATKACKLTNWKDHHFIGALAAVCAEVGDFTAAVKWQKEAIELLTVGERPVWLANYEMRLKLYLSDKKYDKGSLWSFSTGHMVAWWKLDEKSGGIAADSSGNNCVGTLTGNPQWQASSGKLGGAIEFDGDGDHVKIGNESIFDFTNEITVAAWVNITTVPEMWTAIVTKGNSAWRLSTYRKERKFHFNVTGYSRVSSHVHGEEEVGKGEWHHVCGTYDGAYVRLYIDGVEDPASRRDVAYSGRITSNDFDVCIGENSERPGRYWHGLIDDIRIYSYALSQQE
ncbi:MAG: LamG-like jellyroll fold domain-containing protein, partial [Planctomycetota bacterium]